MEISAKLYLDCVFYFGSENGGSQPVLSFNLIKQKSIKRLTKFSLKASDQYSSNHILSLVIKNKAIHDRVNINELHHQGNSLVISSLGWVKKRRTCFVLDIYKQPKSQRQIHQAIVVCNRQFACRQASCLVLASR